MYIKSFYWSTAMLISLHVVWDSLHTTSAELNSYKRGVWTPKPNALTTWPFSKKEFPTLDVGDTCLFLTSLLSLCLWESSIVCRQSSQVAIGNPFNKMLSSSEFTEQGWHILASSPLLPLCACGLHSWSVMSYFFLGLGLDLESIWIQFSRQSH